MKLFKLRRETNQYERDKLRCLDWEFKDGCSQRMCMASIIFNWKRVGAAVEADCGSSCGSRLWKQLWKQILEVACGSSLWKQLWKQILEVACGSSLWKHFSIVISTSILNILIYPFHTNQSPFLAYIVSLCFFVILVNISLCYNIHCIISFYFSLYN